MTTQTAVDGFQRGYQAALGDIRRALATGGTDGVIQWLDDNQQGGCRNTEHAHLGDHDRMAFCTPPQDLPMPAPEPGRSEEMAFDADGADDVRLTDQWRALRHDN
jgi:hypothetical protein